MTHAVAEVIAQVKRRPGVERLADYRAGEGQQTNQQKRPAAHQRQQQRADTCRPRVCGGKQVERVRLRFRVSELGARLAQPQQASGEPDRGRDGGEQEQRAPAVAALDQHPHLLTRRGVSDHVADAENTDDRPVGGIVEPSGGDLDEAGPADRLRQSVSEPGEGEHRDRTAGGEQQREYRGAAYANEEVAPPAPVVSQTGEKQFAQRISEDAEGTDRADADDRLAVTDSPLTQLLDQQGRGHGQIRAAVVTGSIAPEQQQYGSELPVAQRPLRRASHDYCRGGAIVTQTGSV